MKTVKQPIRIAQLNSGKWKMDINEFNDKLFDNKEDLIHYMNSKLSNGDEYYFIEVDKLKIK